MHAALQCTHPNSCNPTVCHVAPSPISSLFAVSRRRTYSSWVFACSCGFTAPDARMGPDAQTAIDSIDVAIPPLPDRVTRDDCPSLGPAAGGCDSINAAIITLHTDVNFTF